MEGGINIKSQVILYISYDGGFEPLVQSQVISYLKELNKKRLKFILLTFDKQNGLQYESKRSALQYSLKQAGIYWISRRYHNWPNMPAKIYDIINGFLVCLPLVQKYNIRIVHARSYIAGAISALLKIAYGTKFLFDIRGILPDERVDGGIWNKTSLKYALSKKIEKVLFRKADELVVLSEKGKQILQSKSLCAHITYIPTCVNLNTFKFYRQKKKEIREQLDLNEKFVLTYAGSLGSWYLLNKMVCFFNAFKRIKKNAYFLMLTSEKKEKVEAYLSKSIDRASFSVRFVSHDQMQNYLSASDAGICFIRQCYSKKFSCPTKIGEYLACGLPVIINAGIGDTDNVVSGNNVGVVINEFNDTEYNEKIKRFMQLIKNKNVKKRCRLIAEQYYSLKNGADKYFEIYQRLS